MAKKKELTLYTQSLTLVRMKRTSILLDEKLVGEGMRLTGIETQKELIDYALREPVRRKEQKSILKLKAKISWEGGDLDELRSNRF
jgi:Arc/MetJ family transcription regulator